MAPREKADGNSSGASVTPGSAGGGGGGGAAGPGEGQCKVFAASSAIGASSGGSRGVRRFAEAAATENGSMVAPSGW